MASKAKWLFVILIAHIVAVILFIAVRNNVIEFIIAPIQEIVFESSNSNFSGDSQHKEEPNEQTHLPGNSKTDTDIPEGFQQIDGKEAWMYSAFFDQVAEQQGRPMVRLIGLAKTDVLVKIYCNFETEDKNLTSTGNIMGLPESHGMQYTASYAECSLPSGVRPTRVSISFQTTHVPNNHFQVLYPGQRIRNFTVCFSVLHSYNNMSSQIIQAIELNRILGAEHFFVYNYSISPNVDQILQRYQEDGLVTVMPWLLPTLQGHYFGQVAALNECFHRNRNTSRFVVAVDTDEYIIPREHKNWLELIDKVSPQETDVSQLIHSSQPVKTGGVISGCFQVLSSFFSSDKIPDWKTLSSQVSFTEEEKSYIMKYKLLTLSQFWRSVKIFPPNDRSKYIARPEDVYMTGIHFVHRFNGAKRCHNIDTKMALVHHYRVSDLTSGIVQDTNILKFKNQMSTRYLEQCKRFPNIFT